MRLRTTMNILHNMLRRGYGIEMARKVGTRLRERRSSEEQRDLDKWLKNQEVDLETWASRLDPSLWAEATGFASELEEHADAQLEQLDVDLGGGGDYRLLYFLVRLRQPDCVVETGVAAGFSSNAILTALQQNGHGHLFSSDFPYFRHRSPEEHIGLLVPQALRSRWTLLIDGDRKNLRKIRQQAQRIDIFHYDSDKSTRGRQLALSLVADCLTRSSVVIFDDIGDNDHFRVWVEHGRLSTQVFRFGGKYLGMAELTGDASGWV